MVGEKMAFLNSLFIADFDQLLFSENRQLS